MMDKKCDEYYYESLDIFENFLTLINKKEEEIKDLYAKVDSLESQLKKYNRKPEIQEPQSCTLGFRVLVATPAQALRNTLKGILSFDGGCTVVAVASDSKELITQCQEQHPSLVVVDIELPTVIDGYLALHSMKAQYPDVKIIVLTRETQNLTLMKIMEIGVYDVISKPVNHRRLVDNLERLQRMA